MLSKPSKSVRWSQQRRLEFIDSRLCWDGRLNRADLCDTFDISVPQASVDIARYSESAPDNLSYDRVLRTYSAGPKFKPAYAATTAEQFLRQRLHDVAAAPHANDDQSIVSMPTPARSINLSVLRPLWLAIRHGEGLRVLYQSLTQPEPQLRTLSPHALAHDGFRWHARAYCHTRRDFRDFVVARILAVKGSAAVALGPTDDLDWNTFVTLKLAPNPRLSPAHRRAIELDYGMTKGQVGLRCRKAMLFYVLNHLGLEETRSTRPEAQQVVLKNAARIMSAVQRQR